MGHKDELKASAEWDILYGRRFYCYLTRAGTTRYWKNRINRRSRQKAKRELIGRDK